MPSLVLWLTLAGLVLGRLPFRGQDATRLGKRQLSMYKAYTIDMPIDHFPSVARYAPHTNGTFKQRYYFDSLIQILMEATNGLGVILENRYYGQSYPFPESTVDNLRFLTTEQTIADNAYFAQHAKFPGINTTENLNAPSKPWILYGGSLAGAQTAFSLKTYPGLLYGGIGSSATTNAVLGYPEWYNPIQKYGPSDCISSINSIVDKIDRAIESGDDVAIQQLKSVFGLDGLRDIRDFAQTIAFPLGGPMSYPDDTWQELNWYPAYSSDEFWLFCKNITNADAMPNVTAIDSTLARYTNNETWTNLGNYANYFTQYFIPTYCPSGEVDSSDCFGTQNSSFWSDTTNSGTRSYMWSACTEQGTYIQAPAQGPSLASRVLQPEYTQQWCTWAFPPGKYASIPATPDLDQYNNYGGLSVEADRLAHVDGGIDPWLDICYHSSKAPERLSTPLRPNLLIPGAGHHWDSSGIKDVAAEPQFIRNAHDWEIIRTVKRWLKGFRALDCGSTSPPSSDEGSTQAPLHPHLVRPPFTPIVLVPARKVRVDAKRARVRALRVICWETAGAPQHHIDSLASHIIPCYLPIRQTKQPGKGNAEEAMYPRQLLCRDSTIFSRPVGRPGASIQKLNRRFAQVSHPQRRHKCHLNWTSQLDSGFYHFHRRRIMRTRAAFRDTIRRQFTWKMPLPFSRIVGTREASHWSRLGSARQLKRLADTIRKSHHLDRELPVREMRWVSKMSRMKEMIDANPYRAVFGQPFEPFWSPSIWKSPECVEESEHDLATTPIIPSSRKPSNFRDKEEPTSSSQAMESGSNHSPTTNLQHQPGNKQENSDRSDTVLSSTITSAGHAIPQSISPTKPSSGNCSAERTSQRVSHSFYDPISGRMIATTTSNTGPLRSVRERPRAPEESPKESTASQSTPGFIPVDTGGALAKSSTTSSLSVSPNQDIDEMTATSIRASMGKASRPPGAIRTHAPSPASREESGKSKKIMNLSACPDGQAQLLKASPANLRLKASLAELPFGASERRPSLEDPREGLRLEASEALARLKASKAMSSLQTLGTRGAPTLQPALDRRVTSDSPAKASKIDQARSTQSEPITYKTLASLVKSRSSPVHPFPNLSQGSKQPDASASSTSPDDGYSHKPSGLQTSYTKETQAVEKNERLPLAVEIAQAGVANESADDGFTTKPVGLQNTFANERQATDLNLRPTLAEEIARSGREQGSQNLTGRTSSLNKLAGDTTRPVVTEKSGHVSCSDKPAENIDGFSERPIGLETSFKDERSKVARGERRPLEEEIKGAVAEGDRAPPALPKAPQLLGTLGTDGSTPSPAAAEDALRIQRVAAAKNLLDSEVANQKSAMQFYTDRVTSGQKVSHHPVPSATRTIAGEGDMCQNVARYANSDKWYKQKYEPTSLASNTSESTKAGSESSSKASSLIEEIKTIIEKHGLERTEAYATLLEGLGEKISSLHCHPQAKHASSLQAQAHDQHEHTPGNQHVGWNDTSKEGRPNKTKKDVPMAPDPKSMPSTIDEQIPLADVHGSTGSSFAWAEPASYKILAYDPNNSWSSEAMQVVSTTSRFSDQENPISVAQALSRVTEPIRFAAHFADLQRQGYQAIHARGNLLVLRKVDGSCEPDGQVMSTSSQHSSETKTGVRTIDPPSPATGNFASPTGFVNHDPIFSTVKPEQATPAEGEGSYGRSTFAADGVYYRRNPRVRRQEPVFSGYQKYEEQRQYPRRRRAGWRRRVRFALSVGATSAAFVYALGVGAELSRGQKEKSLP